MQLTKLAKFLLNCRKKAEEYRAKLVEDVAEGSDELMEKFLEGEEISIDELKAGIRKMVINSEIYPVYCGSRRLQEPRRAANARRCD